MGRKKSVSSEVLTLLDLIDFDPDAMLNEKEAAMLLGISPRTLRNYRGQGRGPRYIEEFGVIRYRRRTLIEWILNKEKRSTSATSA